MCFLKHPVRRITLEMASNSFKSLCGKFRSVYRSSTVINSNYKTVNSFSKPAIRTKIYQNPVQKPLPDEYNGCNKIILHQWFRYKSTTKPQSKIDWHNVFSLGLHTLLIVDFNNVIALYKKTKAQLTNRREI